MAKTWWLKNLDSGEKLEGQYEAVNPTEEIGNTYAELWTLNRQHAIHQFVHGNTDQVQFDGRFFRTSELLDMGTDPQADLDKLKSWARYDDKLKRPPILMFWIGDAHLFYGKCFIEQIGSINYGSPTSSGKLRDVSFSVSLKRWVPYVLEEEEQGETRYHHAKRRDYYEALTQREYGNALMGDVIRKRQPNLPTIQVGDIVILPDYDKIRTTKVTQASVPLKTAFGAKDTPQRRLRLEYLASRNRARYSHVLKDY